MMNPSQPAPTQRPPADPDKSPTAVASSYGLAAISVASRIAEFWVDQPQLWFVQIEAILAPQKLSDENRFNLVVSKLGKDVLQQVSDILREPPDKNKFETLKTRLISVYEESETKQFEKLLSQMELGEQKPSQLLRRMRDLARGKIPDETLCLLWVRHLPTSLRGVLAVTETKNLDSQALVADKIMETMRPIDVAEVSSKPTTSQDLGEQIAKLTAQFAEFQRYFRPWRENRRRYNQNPSRSRPQSREASPRPRIHNNDRNGLCYYHQKFKERAHKCTQPCSWENQEN